MGQTVSQPDENPFMSDNEVFFNNPSQVSTKQTTERVRHPVAATFHVLFKILAILFYLFGGLFGQTFTSTFVSVILLISMDFWVVKNVTGRLLVGLRWSNYIDDEGNSHWIFENKNKSKHTEAVNDLSSSHDGQSEPMTADSSIFWTGLIMAPTIWLLLMFVAIFKFNVQWLMLVILATVLSSSNLYGYVRCRLGTSDIRSSVTQFVAKQVFLSFLTRGGGNSTNVKSMA
jgi:hypothetical protein